MQRAPTPQTQAPEVDLTTRIKRSPHIRVWTGTREHTIDAGVCQFGPPLPIDGLAVPLVHVPKNLEGARAFSDMDQIRGSAVLVINGTVPPIPVVKHCQDAGASAVIFISTVASQAVYTMKKRAHEGHITIPSANITMRDGSALLGYLLGVRHRLGLLSFFCHSAHSSHSVSASVSPCFCVIV